MTGEFSELLDTALKEDSRKVAQESADRPAELTSLLETAALLTPLQEVDWPAETIRAADRQLYLDQVATLPEPTMSARLWAWMPAPLSWLREETRLGLKENTPMTTLAKFAFALVAIFGLGGGSVVLASTDSLPDSWLYSVKLATEDMRVALSDNGAGEAQLHLNLAQERLQEMERLVAQGTPPDSAVLERLRTQLQEAVRTAAGIPLDELPGLLTQMRAQIRTQTAEQAMTGDPTLAQAWQYMYQFGEELENGAREPQQFQHRHANGVSDEWPCGSGECEPAGEQYQYGSGEPGNGPGEPAGPQNQNGPGEAGYGPGEPGIGPGDPTGEQYQYGIGESGNGPGEPGGNSDCPEGCEPTGDQYRYGPGEFGNGPGEPGGTSDCPEGCIPAGSQNHSGAGEPAGGEPQGGPRP